MVSTMIVSGWHDGHGTYGLRVLDADVSLWFRPEWRWVTLHLPGDSVISAAAVGLTSSFWTGSPQIRSRRIKAFLERYDLIPWEKNRPPHFNLEPLGGGVFRLNLLPGAGDDLQ